LLLKMENISKSFGGIKALNNINLSIKEGEIVAIIGPNGAGKTTLFNIINGIYKPDTGRIIYEDIDITNFPPYKRSYLGISRAFQIPKPFISMSVKDNVLVAALFSRKIPSIKEAEKETERVLKLVGLQNKSDMIANDLTSPEKKLLELARSLVTKPKLLLLDEIVAGMPPSDIDNIMSLVVQVAKEEKISVVAMVEHIIRTVKYANRAIFLHQGQILLDSSPDDVLNSDLVRNIYLGEVEHA